MKTDILIVGCGVSGLYCALNLPRDKSVTVITKSRAEESDSFLAQGGICVLRDSEDFASFYEDTMRAGHYENNPKSVELMISSSQDVINDLVTFGARFERDGDCFAYTREGAHSRPRILFHEDETGKEITSHLLKEAKNRKNITVTEGLKMVDLIYSDNTCSGIICEDSFGNTESIFADYTVLATGGIGGLYKNSTNYRHLTADSLALALKYGIRLKNIDYVQIHPTTLFTKKEGRRFLISESVRGEGAILLNSEGKRFVNELLPRDVVTEAILKEMEKEGTEHVWLSLATIPEEKIKSHFPNIYRRCLEEGYDITRESIPVVPAQHYFMGGIEVDSFSKTSAERLYAVGETACNGVHGKNRLASNSLLESLVFAKRAAKQISEVYTPLDGEPISVNPTKDYTDCESKYKKAVLAAIEKEKHNNGQHCI